MEKNTPRVFVVQENSKLNYAPAERFGEVHFMTATEFSPVKNSQRNRNILEMVELAMKAFDPATDYLLLSGNPIVMGYVFHLAMTKASSVRVLWWSRIDNEYTEVVFDPEFIKSIGIPTVNIQYK